MPSLNRGQLQWIAYSTMLIDHIGEIFFPQAIWLRWIGRLAFPIFAYLLGIGFRHTHSRPRYLLRLILLGIISEPIFDYAFEGKWYDPDYQSIYVTLIVGFLALWLLETIREALIKRQTGKTYWQGLTAKSLGIMGVSAALIMVVVKLLADIYFWDYHAYGVFVIIGLYYLKEPLLQVVLLAKTGPGALTPILFRMDNGSKAGSMPRWLSYAFYPGHLALLSLIQHVVSR